MRIIITKVIVLKFLNLTDLITLSKYNSATSRRRNNNINFCSRSCQSSAKNPWDCFNINICSSISFTRRSDLDFLNLTRDYYSLVSSSISNSNFNQTTFTITFNGNTSICSYCIFSTRFVDFGSFNLSC